MSDDDIEALKRKLHAALLPDFKTIAREWLVRVQGHAHRPNEESLAEELRKMYERGVKDGQQPKS